MFAAQTMSDGGESIESSAPEGASQLSSGVSSSTEEFSSNNSSHTGNRSVPEELAAKETNAVRKSRTVFVLLLAAFAIAAAIITFIYSSEAETKDFETQFEDFAYEIDDVTHHNARNTYGNLRSFQATVTSFADFVNVSYPDLTIPHFDIRASMIMETTGADFIALSPVVKETNRSEWERYASTSHSWIAESLGVSLVSLNDSIPHFLHDEGGIEVGEGDFVFEGDLFHVPAWQMSPLTEDALHVINFDLLTHPVFHRIFYYMEVTQEPVFSEVINVTSLFGANAPDFDGHPQSLLVQPVFGGFGDTDREIVAVLLMVIPWDLYFQNLLHDGAEGVVVVLEDTCGDVFTYEINGPDATFVGAGDLHDSKYNHMEFLSEFEPFEWHDYTDDLVSDVNCHYTLKMYPSPELEDEYKTNKPALLTVGVLLVFAFTTAAFAVYDCLVQKRQEKVMDSAMKTNAIVSSLFPADVRDRLFKRGKYRSKSMKGKKKGGLLATLTEAPKNRLESFLSDAGRAPESDELDTKPIADLFLNCTVMFGDIQGFTAWSSVREPSQVFTLLETLYRGFDAIAKRRRVFKVETIGDCYVAVSGLPEPRDDHAVVMARFAKECVRKMVQLTTELEVVLGPDTGELKMRFGLNSGPVTAGVLRGEKSRFQLFGDTVNTAARMEKTGDGFQIQISEETAKLLRKAGREHWFEPREDTVWAKGKGEMQTYWLATKLSKGNTNSSVGQSQEGNGWHDSSERLDSEDVERSPSNGSTARRDVARLDEGKRRRMIGWNVDVLLRLLKQVVATRNASGGGNKVVGQAEGVERLESVMAESKPIQKDVTEFLKLPDFDADLADLAEDPEKIKLGDNVEEQLRRFVEDMSTMYRNNPFHNFEHASHVAMSVNKLLSRIVAVNVAPGEKERGQRSILSRLHEQTYGLSSDPMVQFAVVFTAIIHDVDHSGVPNYILASEDPDMAHRFGNRSVAEQNSFQLAWNRFMKDDMADLRACIYTTPEELDRFHQMLINTIMATDIFDREFAELRKSRWDRCFDINESAVSEDVIDRKATIVIEHVIQASDVAHTMQHWHVYQKWNERLFEEMYAAYQSGRSAKDPSLNWYESELGFFDNYVIPLAKKLKVCGVFGVSSDEYLNYALQNRLEWSDRGKSIVEKCVARFRVNQITEDE